MSGYCIFQVSIKYTWIRQNVSKFRDKATYVLVFLGICLKNLALQNYKVVFLFF